MISKRAKRHYAGWRNLHFTGDVEKIFDLLPDAEIAIADDGSKGVYVRAITDIHIGYPVDRHGKPIINADSEYFINPTYEYAFISEGDIITAYEGRSFFFMYRQYLNERPAGKVD